MPVSERDRAHLRTIGRIKQELHTETLAQHQALSLRERLRRSWQLYIAYRSAVHPRGTEDDPVAFYARARARGLYEN